MPSVCVTTLRPGIFRLPRPSPSLLRDRFRFGRPLTGAVGRWSQQRLLSDLFAGEGEEAAEPKGARVARLDPAAVERQIAEMWDALASFPDPGPDYSTAVDNAHRVEHELRRKLARQSRLDALGEDLLDAVKEARAWICSEGCPSPIADHYNICGELRALIDQAEGAPTVARG